MNQSARSRGMLTAVIVVLAALFAGGCGGSDNPSKPPSGGGTLELNSPNLVGDPDGAGVGVGGVYTHTFATAGTFPYHCKFHQGMTSTVTVQVGGAANAAVTITNNSFSSPVTVAPGAIVTWTNNGSSTHSVTSD